MLELNATAQFRRDLKRCIKRGYDQAQLEEVINTLRIPAPLSPENRDHPLVGNYTGHRECHLQSDWLLIYRIEGNALYLDRTGTHADLFRESIPMREAHFTCPKGTFHGEAISRRRRRHFTRRKGASQNESVRRMEGGFLRSRGG